MGDLDGVTLQLPEEHKMGLHWQSPRPQDTREKMRAAAARGTAETPAAVKFIVARMNSSVRHPLTGINVC